MNKTFRLIRLLITHAVIILTPLLAEAQKIGPRPPPEAYKKVRSEFEAKFEFIKSSASITNYKESKVFLKNISQPIALEIEFDLLHPNVEGTVTAPSFERHTPKQSKYDSSSRASLKMMNVMDSPWKTLQPGGLTHIKHFYSLGNNLLYYSATREMVCFSEGSPPLYPAEESWFNGRGQPSASSLSIRFPIKPKYSPPMYFHMGILPIAYDQTSFGEDGTPLFELNLGSILLEAAAKTTELSDIGLWYSMAAWKEPQTVLSNADYVKCQAEEPLHNKMKGYGPPSCYCVSDGQLNQANVP